MSRPLTHKLLRSTFGITLLGLLLLHGCTQPLTVTNPMVSLRDATLSPRNHMGAMLALDPVPRDKAYLEALHRVLWLPGYTVDVREASLERLKLHDPEGLQVTIRRYLPRMTAKLWIERLCTIIVDEQWIELTPALVSSWARPAGSMYREFQRPEYEALARLYGEDRVNDVVFELFVESSSVSEQGLRTRCWELIHRLGERDRLIDLVENGPIASDDLFLQDLRTGAVDLGVMPHTREEILWLRELCKPEYAEFRSLATQANERLASRREADLEMRDLPILVSALLHEPELLERDRETLYQELVAALREQRHYMIESNYDNYSSGSRQRIFEYHDRLTWGDVAAIRIALLAMQVPQVVDHLFDYARRDMADKGTEYGGVIALDAKGRFEILEFPPRVRHHDRKYNAPQAMFDIAYTSLFHFHYHVQRHRNVRFAGPGFGDSNYADNIRANCLVFTFINDRTLNVDFYRHGSVVVDLGVITRE